MRTFHALAACGLLLAGCAPTLRSTLEEAPPPREPIGEPTAAIPAPEAEAARLALRAKLDALVAEQVSAVPVQLVMSRDGSMRLRAGSDESFEPDSAQLRPGALTLYAALARVLREERAVVAHLLVHNDIATDADPALDLTARRAASLQSVLLAHGAPGARLRAEGRGASEPATDDAAATPVNRRVEVVFQAIVAGREPLAWVPPPPVPCGCGEGT